MGIFSQVNSAQARGVSNYFKAGAHYRVQITSAKQIVSQSPKNAGNEMAIIECKILATTSKDPAMTVGATVTQIINGGRGAGDPKTKMAAGDIKGLLLSQFSEADLAGMDRSHLRPNEVQPDNPPNEPNPYINGKKGITFHEACMLVFARGDDSALKEAVADVETVNVTLKNGNPFTQIHWRPAGHFKEQLGDVGLTA